MDVRRAGLAGFLVLAVGCASPERHPDVKPPAAPPQAQSLPDLNVVALSPGGNHLILVTKEAYRPACLYRFDLDGRLDRSNPFSLDWTFVNDVAFSPDGKWIACDENGCTGMSRVFMIEADSLRLRHVLEGPEDYALLRFSRDSRFLTGVSWNGIFRWQASDGRQVSADDWPNRRNGDYGSANPVPGTYGDQAWVDGEPGFLWDVTKRRKTQTPNLAEHLALFLRDGHLKAIRKNGKGAEVVDIGSGKAELALPAADSANGIFKISPGGKWLSYRAPENKSLILLSLLKPGERKTLKGFFSQNWAFMNDKVVGDLTDRFEAWDIDSGELRLTVIPELGKDDYEQPGWIVFTPDGRYMGSEHCLQFAGLKISAPKKDEEGLAKYIRDLLHPVGEPVSHPFFEN